MWRRPARAALSYQHHRCLASSGPVTGPRRHGRPRQKIYLIDDYQLDRMWRCPQVSQLPADAVRVLA
jgi:hypothetical protein